MSLEELFQKEISLLRDMLSNLVLAEQTLENKDIAKYQMHIDSHLKMQKEMTDLKKQKAPLLKVEDVSDQPVYQEQIKLLKTKIRHQKRANNQVLSQIHQGKEGPQLLPKELKKKILLVEDDPS